VEIIDHHQQRAAAGKPRRYVIVERVAGPDVGGVIRRVVPGQHGFQPERIARTDLAKQLNPRPIRQLAAAPAADPGRGDTVRRPDRVGEPSGQVGLAGTRRAGQQCQSPDAFARILDTPPYAREHTVLPDRRNPHHAHLTGPPRCSMT
jgi:hypothetical protein